MAASVCDPPAASAPGPSGSVNSYVADTTALVFAPVLNARAFSVKAPTSKVVPERMLPSAVVGSAPVRVTRIVTVGSGSVIVTDVPGA